MRHSLKYTQCVKLKYHLLPSYFLYIKRVSNSKMKKFQKVVFPFLSADCCYYMVHGKTKDKAKQIIFHIYVNEKSVFELNFTEMASILMKWVCFALACSSVICSAFNNIQITCKSKRKVWAKKMDLCWDGCSVFSGWEIFQSMHEQNSHQYSNSFVLLLLFGFIVRRPPPICIIIKAMTLSCVNANELTIWFRCG